MEGLTKKQQKAVMLLSEPKAKQVKVAELISVSEATISRWIKSEKFAKAQREYDQFVYENLRAHAVNTMGKLLGARSELVRFNAAKDILDRTGIVPVEKHEVEMSGTIDSNPYAGLTTEELKKLVSGGDVDASS
ncbi:hypothetical protein FC83_GL000925 [Agrilactobacillus composti DSM 18527 = JCM 14202]|uniref:Homeodomain phBC6A51-type domain-containing protein n=1 Tax=Agrilactobacillus composti DSM 18527 = JCM 14202 TaxID=1423734 RepID=A0A0R1Y1G9_9LACO|nr:hypothetical protein FC83_GL000925 [Agrilactobacillus composti DSM 18527 = JCM 14202]